MEDHIALSTNIHMSMIFADLKLTKEELRVTKDELRAVKAENEKQRKLLNELLWCNVDTLIEKCQYFQGMENFVVTMKREFIILTDEIACKISSFDSELKLFSDINSITVLNNFNNVLRNYYNERFTMLQIPYIKLNNSILLSQVRTKLEKDEIILTEDMEQMVIKKAETYHNILMERACEYSIASCNDTTYRERFAALMAICPENGMIMHGDSVVLKLKVSYDFHDWSFQIKKTRDFNRYACTSDCSSKIVEIKLPRFFYSAGIWYINTPTYKKLIFKRKTKQEQTFMFPLGESFSRYALNGFILIEVCDS